MKFIRSIIPIILILIICFISYNTYQNAKSVSNNPLSVIPNHSALILKINMPNKVSSYFYNKKIWNKIIDIFNSKKLNTQLSIIEKLYSKTIIEVSNEELEKHKQFLKTEIKKNFYYWRKWIFG